jgi:hypothetical protein
MKDTNGNKPQRANIITSLPDGRFIIGIGLPIYDREDMLAINGDA